MVFNLVFLREVVRANKSTGAIGPSSQKLAETITDLAELPGNKVLVEYGPGTGVFTEEILRKKDTDAFLLSLEVNESFAESTQQRCPEAKVIHDGAQNTLKYLREMGHEHCDLIISGLPWTRFEEPLQDEILDATYDVLRPGGRFLTFGYSFSPLLPAGKRFFKGKLNEKFDQVRRSKTIWKNLPPCSVYIADKKAD
jgi:phosphatidylethanolamine/phosphatidyl-N-methylethanolamine N-methyltransferase